MRGWLVVCCWLPATAGVTAPKDLVGQAKALEEQAKLQSDPHQQQALQREACTLWSAAYKKTPQPEYLLKLSVCKQREGDLAGAEGDLRTFLVEVGPTHPLRSSVEGAAAELEAQRARQAGARAETKLVVESPLPVSLPAGTKLSVDLPKRETRWWLRGSVAGGLILGASAFLLLRDDGINDLGRAERKP